MSHALQVSGELCPIPGESPYDQWLGSELGTHCIYLMASTSDGPGAMPFVETELADIFINNNVRIQCSS